MAATTKVFEKTDETPDAPTFSRRSSCPPVLSAPCKASGLTGMQPAAGNLEIQRWLRSGGAGAILPKRKVNPPHDAYEQEADRAAEQVASGRESGPMQTSPEAAAAGAEEFLQRKPRGATTANGEGRAAPGRTTESPRDGLPSDAGRPLNAATRRLVEPAFGADFGHVRLHDSPIAQLTAGSLGARAFTHGDHIWLGPGERETDRSLMAHELAHVLQQGDGLYLRRATWLERRAWLSFFDHYLPRKFLNNYMDDTGTPITLTSQEMIDVNPRVNITASLGFQRELAALQASVLAKASATGTAAADVRYIEVEGPGQAFTNGTLGNFTIKYKGLLTVTSAGEWTFDGTMCFYDYWDFDPKPFGTSGRSTIGELKTRVAAIGLPGQPFHIDSMDAPLTQTGTDPRAVWLGGIPRFVPDQAGRAGTDIAVGDVGGGEVGSGAGPETGGAGAEVGGETGAQSAEDLNP
jgi:Domain of unknown function (DUF4157)